jgi:hypothetical protein
LAAVTASLAVGLSFGVAGVASADTFTICREDAVTGCTTALSPLNVTINVASDGEAPFRPFGATFDVSDAIEWDSSILPFIPLGGDHAFDTGFWTQLANDPTNGFTVWALPASTPCGNENEPSCEPTAHWSLPGFTVIGGPLNYVMLEPNGLQSDVISIYNDDNGVAAMSFTSDAGAVPEPATWGLMLVGFGALGMGLRMRRKRALAAA